MADRRGLILVFCLLPFWAGGCAWLDFGDKVPFVHRARSPLPPPDGDLITLDLAVIERPPEDPFLNRDLWAAADEMIVPSERKGLLNSNGFRIGQIVGLTPSALQTLLKSERYCVNRRRRVLAPGTSVTQILGPVYPQASFTVYGDEMKTQLTLDQARFCLEIVPTLVRENHLKLTFIPKVETGEKLLPFQPDLERSSWTVRADKPCRTFPELSWEVTVDPNKLLILGVLKDRPDTLGQRTFTEEEVGRVQRLLVLRVSCSSSEVPGFSREDLPPGSPPPLALQAAYPGK